METQGHINHLKRQVFFEMLNIVGRVFIIVRSAPSVDLGNRCFTDEEKQNGIILVFNAKMHFVWDDEGIAATLVFGSTPQKCFIPATDIIAVYSPELNAQFVAAPLLNATIQPAGSEALRTAEQGTDGLAEVVEVSNSERSKRPEGTLASKKRTKKALPQSTKKSQQNVITIDFRKKKRDGPS